jgi:rRNA maturation RNase YbeY
MASKSKVYFFFKIKMPLLARKKLKKEIEAIFAAENKALRCLNYIFCSDSELLEINRAYLKHDEYTDIITFNLSKGKNIDGEIYISWDRVKDNALKFKEPTSRELRRVIFHGALHLCGYKDKESADRKKMRLKEKFYLNKYQY